MVEESRRYPHQRSIGHLLLAALHDLERGVVDNDFVKSGLDETAGQVLQLLAGLDQQVLSGRNAHGDFPPRVPCPNVQARVSGATVNGQEVEVGVETCEDAILLAILLEIGSRRRKQVRAAG